MHTNGAFMEEGNEKALLGLGPCIFKCANIHHKAGGLGKGTVFYILEDFNALLARIEIEQRSNTRFNITISRRALQVCLSVVYSYFCGILIFNLCRDDAVDTCSFGLERLKVGV
jgi:hypothetical protein